MTALITNMAAQRSKELRDYAEGRRRTARPRRLSRSALHPFGADLTQVAVRRFGDLAADRAALQRLAELDSTAPLDGEVIGAELEGRLVAAISLGSGVMIADPFTRTAEIRSLLKLRRAQLQASEKRLLGRLLATRRPGRIASL